MKPWRRRLAPVVRPDGRVDHFDLGEVDLDLDPTAGDEAEERIAEILSRLIDDSAPE